MKRLLVLFLILLMTACRSEVDRQMSECSEQFPESIKTISDINDRWADALEVAASTARMSLSGQIGELQSIRRFA